MAFESWKERAQELETEVCALYVAFHDRRTPITTKAAIALTVAYAVSPIDSIPDVIPGLGYFDELVVLPHEVVQECRDRAG